MNNRFLTTLLSFSILALISTNSLSADSRRDRQIRELERQCQLIGATGGNTAACELMLRSKRGERGSSRGEDDPAAAVLRESMTRQQDQHQQLMNRADQEWQRQIDAQSSEEIRAAQALEDEYDRQKRLNAEAEQRSRAMQTYQPATSALPSTTVQPRNITRTDGACTPVDAQGRECITVESLPPRRVDRSTVYTLRFTNSCSGNYSVVARRKYRDKNRPSDDGLSSTGLSGGTAELVCLDDPTGNSCGGFNGWYVRCPN